ncbi:MAG: hypothetical protein QHJ82_15755, partial [Verrucomicrobiota bacterium]|nr:hypothetical protein [Verrucomicrobiota bacterium]
NSWRENLRKYKWLSNITKYSLSLAVLPKSSLVESTACGLETEILPSGRRFPWLVSLTEMALWVSWSGQAVTFPDWVSLMRSHVNDSQTGANNLAGLKT